MNRIPLTLYIYATLLQSGPHTSKSYDIFATYAQEFSSFLLRLLLVLSPRWTRGKRVVARKLSQNRRWTVSPAVFLWPEIF
ncbi:MAG: hypothetical protein MESAZ_02525 [Saezia sanguinis]